ncbi:MAG: RNA-binding S4 domain-containing protein [Pirellulaceae bacterium]|nr:RNA-binding S4 domain-containing protein [Pirellulaceae bacterium]
MSDEKSIHLEQFLKVCGIIGSGGQAKILIQSGQVMVNGRVETRRKRQLKENDVVELLGERWIVESQF